MDTSFLFLKNLVCWDVTAIAQYSLYYVTLNEKSKTIYFANLNSKPQFSDVGLAFGSHRKGYPLPLSIRLRKYSKLKQNLVFQNTRRDPNGSDCQSESWSFIKCTKYNLLNEIPLIMKNTTKYQGILHHSTTNYATKTEINI